MASIKLGAMLADIKGKLAGNYFAKRKNTTVLAVCGSKLTKADAGRTALQKQRNRMSLVARAWAELTSVQRTVWANQASLLTWYTKVGIAYTPSGYQLFSQLNSNRLFLNLALLTDYVEPLAPADINRCNVTFVGSGVLQYSYDGTATTGKIAVVSMSYPNSYGVLYPKGGYKKIFQPDSDESGPIVFSDNYSDVYGTAANKGLVFVKIDIYDAASGICEGSKLTKADAGLV